MSVKEINPKETTRASAFELWMEAPNPMVTFFKTYDVMPLIKVSKKYDMKFNMLLDFCIGKAAASVKEFYLLPVGNKLIPVSYTHLDVYKRQQPTMWVSWRNVRMALFIPWRVTLAMPANRISILSAAALFMAMVYLPIKKRTAHYGLFYTYHFRSIDFVDFTISIMAFNSLSLQSERI